MLTADTSLLPRASTTVAVAVMRPRLGPPVRCVAALFAWLSCISFNAAASETLPFGPVRVVALKMDAGNTALDRNALLRNKLLAVSTGIGAANVDLVVTPEYTFYRGYENDPVRLLPDKAGYYQVVSTGTAKSDEIVAAVNETMSWAQSNNVNVILGTVADRVTTGDDPTLPANVVFNTQLIIDRQGRIAGYRRKVTEWTSLVGLGSSALKQKALQTVRAFTLSTKNGTNVVVLPVICDEENDFEMLTKAANINADLVVNSQRVQEFSLKIENATKSIQQNAWSPSLPGWKELLRNVYIHSYVANRNAVKPGGWLVVANSESSTAGMLELNVPPKPLESLSITGDYVYGVIRFISRDEPSNRAPVVSAPPSVTPNAIVLPEKATVNVTAGDPDSGPVPLYFTWNKVSGAGTVTFLPNGTATSASSRASFSLPGPYILRVEISDGLSETTADVGILVTDGNTPSNKGPAVSAGPSSTVVFPALAQLKGMVLDDGMPSSPGAVTSAWSHSYSPGTLTFGKTSTLATTVKASKPGTYLVRLTASDGALSSAAYAWITFEPTTFSIAGRVATGSGAAVPGVTVSHGLGYATTDGNGAYTIANLFNGVYTVTPAKSGYGFTPASQTVTLSGAKVTGKNFTTAAFNLPPSIVSLPWANPNPVRD